MAAGNLNFVEVPTPGLGNTIAESAARLLLEGIETKPNPTQAEIADMLTREVDSSSAVAVLDPADTVIGTGGLKFYEVPDGESLIAIIANVAVESSRRGEGIGIKIISVLEARSQQYGLREMLVIPVKGAAPFYERLDYTETTRPYVEGPVHAKFLTA